MGGYFFMVIANKSRIIINEIMYSLSISYHLPSMEMMA